MSIDKERVRFLLVFLKLRSISKAAHDEAMLFAIFYACCVEPGNVVKVFVPCAREALWFPTTAAILNNSVQLTS